jgi:hypothetical protein
MIIRGRPGVIASLPDEGDAMTAKYNLVMKDEGRQE